MIMGIPDSANGAAKVSIDVIPCTERATPYSTSPETGLRCLLWDTRGLGEAVDMHHRGWKTKLADWFRLMASQDSQQAQELKRALQGRIIQAKPILVWCMHATKINVPTQWQEFRKVYVEYCGKQAIPTIVITRMRSEMTDWKEICNRQIQDLDLREGSNTVDVPISRVREYPLAKTPSDEYNEDSEALRDLISNLMMLD